MSAVLQIRDLRVAAGDTEIVHGVSLDLAPGEVLGLIGESGAGKSTIALAAMGYGRGACRITGGTIRLAGTELTAASRDERAAVRGTRIAYVAQSAAAAFNPALRVDRQILEVPRANGVPEAEARAWMLELFRALQLPEPETFGRRYPHQVSGGQLQRAMIAMAMAGKPDILILDEPTTALDVTTQIEVLALLREVIRRYGTAALYITHDLAVIAQIADRLVVLRGGLEVETGPTAQILAAPRQPYTQALVAERQEVFARPVRPEHHTGERILEVTDVSASYGPLAPVLHGVSLTLDRGETLAVVGESGSGKSTLARLIAGLLPPDAGSVRFAGRALPGRHDARSRDDLRAIQLICQLPDVALNPRQTVGAAIGRPLTRFRGLKGAAARAEVARLLAQTGLSPDLAARLPGALSGGQKQRVCIARALAAKPDLLICDEVTSALDPLVAEEILRLLRRLQDETGVACLFITHDLSVVQRLADRVLVLERGRLIETGSTAGLFADPRQPYTRRLLDSVPQLRTDWLDEVMVRRAAS